MVEFVFTLRDADIYAALDKVQRMFGREGQQALFEEWERRVERLVEIPYPQHTYAPLPKRYRWNDGQLHKFKSLRAQRGFFAALRDGRAKVPYQRTNKLRDALEFALAVTNGKATLALSLQNRGRFKPEWVLGRADQQAEYFAKYTNWEPLEDKLKRPPLYDDIQDAAIIAFETMFEELRL